MKTHLTHLPRALALLGIAAGLLLPRLSAQQIAMATAVSDSCPRPDFAAAENELITTVVRFGIPPSDGELTPAVQAHLARAGRLTGQRRYAAAEQVYRRAAAIARREGHLPSLTLWRLASALYYKGDVGDAVDVLVRLRMEAARHGDLVVEAFALYNAAWLTAKAGRGVDARTNVADLRTLLRSPYMPGAIRDHLNAKLAPTGGGPVVMR